MTSALAFLVLAYLVAAVPFGLVVSTAYGGDVDIRLAGSGNIGATNVARVYGWQLAGPVMALDIAKGFLPVWLAGLMWPDWPPILWGAVVTFTVWSAHCFSVYLEFRGGKGVATGAGAMLALAPLPTGLAILCWGAILGLTGRSSVAALLGVISLVGMAWTLQPEVLWVAGALAVATIGTHYTNIRRLVRGEEGTVVRPVRWRRSSVEKASPEQVLFEGPGGGASVARWRETIDDPIEAPRPVDQESSVDEPAEGPSSEDVSA